MARRAFGGDADRRTMAEVPGSDTFPDLVSVDLDGKDPNAFEIDVVDDTPDEDRGRPNAKRYTADDEEDLSQYADKTRKRIERLKFETHSERRQREAAERERDEAVRLAKQHADEVADLRRRLESGGAALASSMVAEREARIADAERRLSAAHADGDGAAIAAATKDLTAATAELAQIKARAPRPAPEGDRQPERRDEVRQPAQAQPQLAKNVAAWIDHNRDWFNRDQERTAEAMSIHYKLVAEGIRPDSDTYTRELDKRLKQSYPDHRSFGRGSFEDDEQSDEEKRAPRRTYGGEPTGRVQEDREKANPRRITLTSTELAIAKRLGVTPQAYAAEKAKREARTNGAGA